MINFTSQSCVKWQCDNCLLFKVAFIRTNSLVNDPRVTREAGSLAKHDFHVLILAWDRERGNTADNCADNIVIKRFRLKAPVGSPLLVLFFPIFWSWAFLNLFIFRPHAVHTCDFDTVPAGLITKILIHKTKLVYDCFEYYPGMVQNFLGSSLVKLIKAVDKFFTQSADCVIIPSEERKNLYRKARYFNRCSQCTPFIYKYY